MPFVTSGNRPLEDGTKVVQMDTMLPKKGTEFWRVFAFMCICLSLSALEVSTVSTALPTIVNALYASRFIPVGSAYVLASAAFLPMSGGLAQVFGRRPVMLLAIGLFALGSGICGAANSTDMFIAGRVVQGMGGGGIWSLATIILADLVTLQERGIYSGLYGLVWCLAALVGPIVGGSLASRGQWRWIFYVNVPVALVACLLVVFLMDLPIPPGSYREKLMRMDWIGSFLVVASIAAFTVGSMWDGIPTPGGSATMLVPLVLGHVGLGIFIAHEATLATHPLVPFSLITNQTSLSGYMQVFYSTMAIFAVIYYVPVYFQACESATPVQSGIYSLALVFAPLASIMTGVSIRVIGRYRPQMWLGWILSIIAFALMSTVLATDRLEKSIGCLVLLGLGAGMLSATSIYAIQAPLPVSQNAPALAFVWFLRSLASVWGITIGSTILQNELARKLPPWCIQCVPQGPAIMYVLIPELSTLPPENLSKVQDAFADSLAALWRILAAVSCAGLVAASFTRELPLHSMLDGDWTSRDENADRSVQSHPRSGKPDA